MGGATQHDVVEIEAKRLRKCPVALCFSQSRLVRTKYDMEEVFSCCFIALRLVRFGVRCFVDFLLRLSLWPGHAEAMDG